MYLIYYIEPNCLCSFTFTFR